MTADRESIAWPGMPEVPVETIGSMGPTHAVAVLYRWDGIPVIYMARDGLGDPVLGYLGEQRAEGVYRHLIGPTSSALVHAFRSGEIPLREAFENGVCWVLDTDESGRPLQGYQTTTAAIPGTWWPVDGWPFRGRDEQ